MNTTELEALLATMLNIADQRRRGAESAFALWRDSEPGSSAEAAADLVLLFAGDAAVRAWDRVDTVHRAVLAARLAACSQR